MPPAEQKKRRENREQKERRKLFSNKLGGYVFVSVCNQNLSPATAARLIYLSTFLNYDGIIYKTERTPMMRGDLSQIMMLSKSETYTFWGKVKNTFISEPEEGFLRFCDDFSFRGKMPKSLQQFQQFYIKSVQDLYKKTPTRKHKYLGYVFSLLQYINIEHNILCFNPTEKLLNDIRPITVNDFCRMIGYDIRNRARLLETYASITFPFEGKNERFCSFITDRGDIGKAMIIVNPHILYHGQDGEHVRKLGKFCEPKIECSTSFCGKKKGGLYGAVSFLHH